MRETGLQLRITLSPLPWQQTLCWTWTEAETGFLFLTQVLFVLFNVKTCCYVNEHPAGQPSIILSVPKVQTETGKMGFGFSASASWKLLQILLNFVSLHDFRKRPKDAKVFRSSIRPNSSMYKCLSCWWPSLGGANLLIERIKDKKYRHVYIKWTFLAASRWPQFMSGD